MIFGPRRAGCARLVFAGALLAALPAGGCSFMFVDTPVSDNGIRRPGDCTGSLIPPILDSVVVATQLGSALYESKQNDVPNKGATIALDLTAAAVWLSSAVYGYYFTTECRRLKVEQGPNSRRVERTVLSGPSSGQ